MLLMLMQHLQEPSTWQHVATFSGVVQQHVEALLERQPLKRSGWCLRPSWMRFEGSTSTKIEKSRLGPPCGDPLGSSVDSRATLVRMAVNIVNI